MIEPLAGFPEGVLAFACHGHVTRSDYDTVLVPAVKRALAAQKKLRLYYETAANFTGLEPGAMWEDFKVGMEHLTRWERIAVISDFDWIRQTVRFFSFILPGNVRTFRLAEAEQARHWIKSA